jgi:hypothetical protein
MSKTAARLPEGFAALEPFVDDWAIATSAARAARRDDSSAAEQQHFYDGAREYLEPALALLDAKPLDEHDAKERRLLDLMMTLAHISIAVEVQRDFEPKHTEMRRHMRITRTPADLDA